MEANESLAYIAGILDGEGTVGVYANGATGNSLVVIITNSCEDLIDYIDACLPGNKYFRYGKYFDLRWHGQDAEFVLELLLPYLIVKRDGAEVGIEFYRNCIYGRVRNLVVTEAERILRNSYIARTKELNSH